MILRLIALLLGTMFNMHVIAGDLDFLERMEIEENLCTTEDFHVFDMTVQEKKLPESTMADIIECRLNRNWLKNFEISKELALLGGGEYVDRNTLDAYYYKNAEYICSDLEAKPDSSKSKFIKECIIDDLCGFKYDIKRGLRFILDMTAFSWPGNDSAVCAITHVARYGGSTQSKLDLLAYAKERATIYNNSNFLQLIAQLENLIQNME